jgi:hypothetical protein
MPASKNQAGALAVMKGENAEGSRESRSDPLPLPSIEIH